MEITARVNFFFFETTSGTVRDLALNRERENESLLGWRAFKTNNNIYFWLIACL